MSRRAEYGVRRVALLCTISVDVQADVFRLWQVGSTKRRTPHAARRTDRL